MIVYYGKGWLLKREATWPFSENRAGAQGAWQLLWAGGLTCQAVGELVTVALLGSALTSPARPVPACTPIRHQTGEYLSEAAAVIGDGAGPTAVWSPSGVPCAPLQTSLGPCAALCQHQVRPT